MTIIDAHTHPFGPAAYADLSDKIKTPADVAAFRTRHPDLYQARLTEPAQDFADELIADMDRHGISKALVQPTPGKVTNELVAKAVKKQPARLVGLFRLGHEWQGAGYVKDPEPARQAAPAEIAYCVEKLRLTGCGELPVRAFSAEIHPEKIAEDLAPLMAAFAAYDMPVMFPTGWTQFPGALYLADPTYVDEIASRYPTVRIVLHKMGFGVDHYFAAALIVAMRNANVYLDTVATTAMHIRKAVDMIGADRIMFGSDWSPTWRWVRSPLDLYATRLQTLQEARLPDGDMEQILAKTAVQVFKL